MDSSNIINHLFVKKQPKNQDLIPIKQVNVFFGHCIYSRSVMNGSNNFMKPNMESKQRNAQNVSKNCSGICSLNNIKRLEEVE